MTDKSDKKDEDLEKDLEETEEEEAEADEGIFNGSMTRIFPMA